jgi:hypothetical protein
MTYNKPKKLPSNATVKRNLKKLNLEDQNKVQRFAELETGEVLSLLDGIGIELNEVETSFVFGKILSKKIVWVKSQTVAKYTL